MDAFAKLREQIDMFKFAKDQSPKRIRILTFVPKGMTFLAPCEELDEVPALGRTIGDGGPVEVLINPEDWDAQVAQWTKFGSDSPFASMTRVMGIPVIDQR